MRAFENPEFLRYVRSELRPARVATIMGSTLGVSLLIAMFLSAVERVPGTDPVSYWRNLYAAVFGGTAGILVLWSLLNCSQAIVSERTQRTFDFWRTTRLSPLTLATGKLFGAPIGAWLQFLTALPVLVVTGALGNERFTTLFGSYAVIIIFTVGVNCLALCLSMRAQDARRSTTLIAILLVFVMPSLGRVELGDSPPGASAWSAFNPASAIAMWHQGIIARVSLFGHLVPSLLVTVLLWAIVSLWCLTALVRCVKLDPDQRSLFSSAQVVGLAACVLLFVYAAFRPWNRVYGQGYPGMSEQSMGQLSLSWLVWLGIVATLICLYFTVVFTLLSRDNLRHGLRSATPARVAVRLVAPWLAITGLSLAGALLALKGYQQFFFGAGIPWVGIVGTYLAIAAYAFRDGMFLEWMIVQRVKAPVLKGTALLACYYVGSSVFSALIASPEHSYQVLRWLAPVSGEASLHTPAWLIVPVVVPPLATAALLANGVFRKMQRVGNPIASPVTA